MSLYYEPVEVHSSQRDCMDLDKFNAVVAVINNDSRLSDADKTFLKLLATRQITFKYENIANYYAQANDVMKEYLEELHTVIVDTDGAIKNGYFEYFEEYEKLIKGIVNEK